MEFRPTDNDRGNGGKKGIAHLEGSGQEGNTHRASLTLLVRRGVRRQAVKRVSTCLKNQAG